MAARRNRSEAHPGVSVTALSGGRHRLRWREVVNGERVAQSWTIYGTAADANRWALSVSESLQLSGTFRRPTDAAQRPVQPERPAVGDLRDAFVGYANWRITKKRVSDGTRDLDALNLKRIETEIRALAGLPNDTPIPADLLSIDLCDRLQARVEASGAGQSRQAQVMRTLWGAWAWASDTGAVAGLGAPPKTKSLVVPSVETGGRLMKAPTMREMDAILHHAGIVPRSDSNARSLLEIMRATGLRISQVKGIRVEHLHGLDSPVPTLDVRVGKSKKEKLGRTVPVAPVLAPLLRELVGERQEGPLLKTMPSVPTLAAIMEAAEGAGDIRPDIWRDARRGNRKLSHWARAGFQRHLRRKGVEDRVIDVLVGHAAKTVRDGHYDDADWAELVEAVRLVPGVGCPDQAAAKVVPLAR